MNSDIVKPEKSGHLHLVYHFTVHLKPAIYPLLRRIKKDIYICIKKKYTHIKCQLQDKGINRFLLEILMIKEPCSLN